MAASSQNVTIREPGLPDGFISNQKSKFGQILEVLGMENVDIFCDLS
jgi:hypothetical protein